MSAIHDAFPHLLATFPDPSTPGVFPFVDTFQISVETQTPPPLNMVLLRDQVDVLPLTCFDSRVVSDSELDAFLMAVHSRVQAEDWPPRFSNESKRWFREVFPLCRRDLFVLWERGFVRNGPGGSGLPPVPQNRLLQVNVSFCLEVAAPLYAQHGIYHDIPDPVVMSFLQDQLSDWWDVLGPDAFSRALMLELRRSAYDTFKEKLSSRALVAPPSYRMLDGQGLRFFVAPNAGHWQRWYKHITRSQAESGVLGVRDLIYQAEGILSGDDELAKSYLQGWLQSITSK